MLKSTIVNNANFYMDENGNFRDAHLVNDKSYNKDLGIEYIGLRNPETKKTNAPIFKLSLVLDNGITVFGDIFVNNDGETMSIRWPQDKFVNAQGNTDYINKVNVPSAITAQVLRHAHTKAEVVEGVQQPAPAHQEVPAQQAQPVEQEVPVQQEAPVQQEQPANNELNINEMSPSDLEALVASITKNR